MARKAAKAAPAISELLMKRVSSVVERGTHNPEVGRSIRPPATSVQKGNCSEAKILARFLQQSYKVSIPFGSGCRYDLVIDDGRQLLKVQCKTARFKKGCIIFYPYSTPRGKPRRQYDKSQIDLFAVYYEELDKVYLIPVEKVPHSSAMSLRIDPARNSQKSGINDARNYEI